MLDHMLEDRVILVKKDGTLRPGEIPSLVTKGQVQIHDTSIPIEVDDHLLRKLPNGLVEDYVVKDPVLQSGLGLKFFTVYVRRSSAPAAPQPATVQNITNNFHGANSRLNIGSTDNSTNISHEFDVDKLKSFISQVQPAISSLPECQQKAIAEPLAVLESEVKSDSPSPSKIGVALQSIKTIAEGAAGNLIATGIAGMVTTLMSTPGISV